MTFLDTNILVYAVDKQEPVKHKIAAAIVEEAFDSNRFIISSQVLFEFANVCVKKLKLTTKHTLLLFDDYSCFECIHQSPRLVRRAIEVQSSYKISMPDAMIVAAANMAGCDELLTEDLNDGQVYAGVRVRNPFKGS